MILKPLIKQKPEFEKTLTDLKNKASGDDYIKFKSLISKIDNFNPSEMEADSTLAIYKTIIADASKYFNSDEPIPYIKNFIQNNNDYDDITKNEYLSKLKLLEEYDFGIQCWNVTMFILNDMIEDDIEKQELINDIKSNPEKYKAGLSNFEEGFTNWNRLKEKIGFVETIKEKNNSSNIIDDEVNPIVDALTKTDINFVDDTIDDIQYSDEPEKNIPDNDEQLLEKQKENHEKRGNSKKTDKNNNILINNFKTALEYRDIIDDIASYIAARTNDSMEANKDYSKFVIPLSKFIVEDGEKIIKEYSKYENIIENISKDEINTIINISKEDIDKHEMGFVDTSKINTYEEFTKMYKNGKEKESA